LLAWAPPRGVAPEAPRVVVLDVGQGDAVLVQGRTGAILVDAGAALRGGFDFGLRVVVPALAALGVRDLDLVIATHADLDHRGGLPAVLREIPVGQLWLPFGGRAVAGFAETLHAARDHGVPVRERGAGDPIVAFGDLRVEPLWPPEGSAGRERSSNNRSLVVRIAVAGRSVLLPGDLEASGESRLVARAADLHADVLVLPHHGSRTSSSAIFLAAVSPVVAIASAPCQGRYQMPHADVLARSRGRGFPVWWTGRDGAVVIGLTPRLHVAGSGVPRPNAGARCGGEKR
jgi:competence protein ComEC